MSSSVLKKMAVDAIVQLVHRDEEGQPHYLWRRCAHGRWLDVAQQGSLTDLQVDLAARDAEICLMVDGAQVVIQTVSFEEQERKHLRSLVPFEFEEQVTEELDNLHFSLGKIAGNQVTAGYVDHDWLNAQISELEGLGLDVTHCYPEPLMLTRGPNSWTLSLDDRLTVHYGEGLGFSVETSLAPLALNSLCSQQPLPEEILLVGGDRDAIQALFDLLPEVLHESLSEGAIQTLLADRWERLVIDQQAELELRQGQFARQLPYKRWIADWRNVGILAAVAIVAYVVVNVAQIQVWNNKRADLVQQQMAVYRQVVPQGNIADPEKQLQNQIAGYETSSASGSVLELYAKVAPLIAGNKEIILRNLRYTAQTGDMQVTLEAETYGSVVALSEAINATGLQARLQNTSQQGGRQQARMVISGVAL